MASEPAIDAPTLPPIERPWRQVFSLLWRDKFAFVAALFLMLMLCCALFGPSLLGDVATKMDLKQRNAPPFELERGWLFFLGADALGRSILARIIVASQNTLAIAGAAVALALIIGGTLGLDCRLCRWLARQCHYAPCRHRYELSHRSLLAVVVLYMFEPRVANLVLVLALTRIPLYLRTCRAEVLEVRERMFVSAARVMGASRWRILFRHIAPIVVPTLITVATLDFAVVMLAESALSFLGIGIQPPEVTWGLMVAQGRNYLASAWWLAFLAGPRDHAHHHGAQSARKLGQDSRRSRAALAS